MSRRSKRNSESPIALFSFQDIITSVTGVMLLITLLLTIELVMRQPGVSADHSSTSPIEQLREQVEQRKQQRDTLQKRLAANEQLLRKLAGERQMSQAELDAMQQKLRDAKAMQERLAFRRDENKRVLKQEQANIVQADNELKQLLEALKQARAQAEAAGKRPTITVLGGRVGGKSPMFLEVEPDLLTVASLRDNKTAQRVESFSGPNRAQRFAQWLAGRNNAAEYFVLLVRPDGVNQFMPLRQQLSKAGFEVGWDVWPQPKTLFLEIEKEQP